MKLISVVLAFSLSGCSLFGPNLQHDLTVCAEKVGADGIQRMEAILLGSNVQAQVDAFAVQFGVDGAMCALQAAIANFKGIQGAHAQAALTRAPAGLAAAAYSQAIAAGQAEVARLSRK